MEALSVFVALYEGNNFRVHEFYSSYYLCQLLRKMCCCHDNKITELETIDTTNSFTAFVVKMNWLETY